MSDAYYDEQGRRRIDRDGTHQPGSADSQQTIEALMARLIVAEGKLEKALAEISTIKSRSIIGPGHSGSIGNGQAFDPNLAGSGGGGDVGTWRNMTDCDGVTMDVRVKNVVEP